MLTVAQSAALMSVTTQTIRRWIKAGQLTAHKHGRDYVVDEKELEKMRDRRGPGRPRKEPG